MYQSIYCDRKTSTIHLWDDIHGYTSFKDEPYAYRKSRNGKYKSIFGDSLERITKFNFRDPSLFSSDIRIEFAFFKLFSSFLHTKFEVRTVSGKYGLRLLPFKRRSIYLKALFCIT